MKDYPARDSLIKALQRIRVKTRQLLSLLFALYIYFLECILFIIQIEI